MSVTLPLRGKSSRPAVEGGEVQTAPDEPKPAPRRRAAAKPKAKPAAKTGAKPAARRSRAEVEPAPAPPPAPARRRRRLLALAAALVLVAAAGATAGYLLVRDDGPGRLEAGEPVLVEPERLREVAAARSTPIYWAGPARDGALELSTTSEGTYVRYLAPGQDAGDTGVAPTVASYPLEDAYASAVERARSDEMASRRLPGGGIAVWQREGATSVYLAFRDVPVLVEVYDPDGAAARRLALSGAVVPVR